MSKRKDNRESGHGKDNQCDLVTELFGVGIVIILILIVSIVTFSFFGTLTHTALAAIATALGALGTLTLAFVTYRTLAQNEDLIQLQRNQVEELRKDRELTEKRLKESKKDLIMELINDGLRYIIEVLESHQKIFVECDGHQASLPDLPDPEIDDWIEEDLKSDFRIFVEEFREYCEIYEDYSQGRGELYRKLEEYFESEFRPDDFDSRLEDIAQNYDRYDNTDDLYSIIDDNSYFLAEVVLESERILSEHRNDQQELYEKFQEEIEMISRKAEFRPEILELAQIRDELMDRIDQLVYMAKGSEMLYFIKYPINETELRNMRTSEENGYRY